MKMQDRLLSGVSSLYLVHFHLTNQQFTVTAKHAGRHSFWNFFYAHFISVYPIICLDSLFRLSLYLSLSPPQGWKQWGCKVPLFPQLLSIALVTVRLSITLRSDPHRADQACWHARHTHTHTQNRVCRGSGEMKGVLSAPAGPHWRICRRRRYTHTCIHTAGH